MTYSEYYVIEYLSAGREWLIADTFDSEADAVRVFNRKCVRASHRTFRVRREMSVTIAQCSRGT